MTQATPDLLRRRAGVAAERAGLAACYALPLALLHARAVAEMLIAAIDILFLLHVWAARDLAWLRRPFAWAACAWWTWLVLCSALGTGGLLLGTLAIRLPLLSIAMGEWLLPGGRGARHRHLLWLVLAAALAWIGLECWQQALTGHNLFGQPRWPDGALTGPFNKPRAGPAFILLFFPVLVPVAAQPGDAAGLMRARGLLLAALGVATILLIGQRMPSVLMVLGLGITALLLPRLRVAVLAVCLCGAVLVAALPAVSPATHGKLVVRFSEQMRHFAASDYGLIFVRALGVVQLHPWTGLGFDGFRRGCADPRAMHGQPWLGVPDGRGGSGGRNGGLRACNLHPHNYYLEAADDAGWPGAALFAVLALTALVPLGRGLGQATQPLRAGLFAGALVALWPVASTSALTSMPNGGWVFLLIGLGFAAGTRDAAPRLDRADGGRAAT